MVERVLAEMVDIALNRQEPSDTVYFEGISLEPSQIRWGCMRILEWLRAQSVTSRVRPSALRFSSPIDQACIRLLEEAEFLREMFQVKDGCLDFSDEVSLEEAQALMAYAREHYQPPLLVHSRGN